METKKERKVSKDRVLIVWIVCVLLWDIFLFGGTSYLVFYKGFSGWWFVLAVLCGESDTLMKALKKRLA